MTEGGGAKLCKAGGAVPRQARILEASLAHKPPEEARDERWEDVRATAMQDSVKATELVTPPWKKVRDEAEEVVKGIHKAPPTTFSPIIGVGDVQVPVRVPPPPLPVKHAPGVRKSNHLKLRTYRIRGQVRRGVIGCVVALIVCLSAFLEDCLCLLTLSC